VSSRHASAPRSSERRMDALPDTFIGNRHATVSCNAMFAKSDSLNEPRRHHLRDYGKTYPRPVALTSPSPRWGEGRVRGAAYNQPEHPRIGHLVAEIARQTTALLERKRRGERPSS
jgi:hypothetical protein